MVTKKLFIAGGWVDTGNYIDVYNPFDKSLIEKISLADEKWTEKAIDYAYANKHIMAGLTAKERGEILNKVSNLIIKNSDEIASIIAKESGKSLRFAKGEVLRSSETFQFAADEARRLSGELIPFDAAATGKNRVGYYKRYPLGVIGAITPFNFPLNLVSHKVAPAIAAGNTVILKPASTTPLTALRLVEILLEAGLPKEGINLLVGSGSKVGNKMVESDKIGMISFTGSPEVGLEIKKKAGMKKVTLELGNNSAVIIHNDADIAQTLPKCVIGGFANSGQVCISIQRIYVHNDIADEFIEQFSTAVKNTPFGSQLDESVVVGPMIEEKEAIRVEEWVNEAISQGAKLICGGKRNGAIYEPTVLLDTNENMKVVREEIFGPVVCIMRYNSIEEAIEKTNNSKFGLQAGIFTKDIKTAFKAIEGIDVGGVMVNDMPTFRVDQMPYGGVKLSGTGREGPKFAVEEMTEIKTVVFNLE
ncbi:MAG: aldehyde dehydrogenase family protein [Calditerrivibrio sp.]|nr:aldehyde dehydrogenase family protein [Calditerrivibrio sp.]MCA1980515.1 aldehyde dehydrogenase family protein [Calditerrivibrio sp.]